MRPLYLLCCGMLLVPLGAFGQQPRSSLLIKDTSDLSYQGEPDICRLDDGRLMCVFYAGWYRISLPNERHPKGGRIEVCYSADEGSTWTPPAPLYDGGDDEHPAGVVQLDNGTVCCTFYALRETAVNLWRPTGTYVIASKDGGESWGLPYEIASLYISGSPIRQLQNGTLVLGLHRVGGAIVNGAITLSRDRGKSWSLPLDLSEDSKRLAAETDVIQLKDGWVHALQGSVKDNMYCAASGDNGLSWSDAASVDFRGNEPYLHRNATGVIICACRRPFLSLMYSTDECLTWSDPLHVDRAGGSSPSVVSLSDGSSLIVYTRLTRKGRIYSRRFRATADGIEWLASKMPVEGAPPARSLGPAPALQPKPRPRFEFHGIRIPRAVERGASKAVNQDAAEATPEP